MLGEAPTPFDGEEAGLTTKTTWKIMYTYEKKLCVRANQANGGQLFRPSAYACMAARIVSWDIRDCPWQSCSWTHLLNR